uniref:Uncharacterized protein n=1 Tax=Rousettus aegyptiacus TaxID=9407 RepID=A0A7J8F120_ROUAE|nr:hypothetical protein HJG63_012401 [Rousettus aegyptiacus]
MNLLLMAKFKPPWSNKGGTGSMSAPSTQHLQQGSVTTKQPTLPGKGVGEASSTGLFCKHTAPWVYDVFGLLRDVSRGHTSLFNAKRPILIPLRSAFVLEAVNVTSTSLTPLVTWTMRSLGHYRQGTFLGQHTMYDLGFRT